MKYTYHKCKSDKPCKKRIKPRPRVDLALDPAEDLVEEELQLVAPVVLTHARN